MAPDVLARFASLNMNPMSGIHEAFADYINATMETWAGVLKRANIKTLD